MYLGNLYGIEITLENLKHFPISDISSGYNPMKGSCEITLSIKAKDVAKHEESLIAKIKKQKTELNDFYLYCDQCRRIGRRDYQWGRDLIAESIISPVLDGQGDYWMVAFKDSVLPDMAVESFHERFCSL